MSWSIGLIGKASNIAAALKEYSETLQGQSKVEFDDALPILLGVTEQNFNKTSAEEPTLKLEASGSGYTVDGEQKQRSLTVKIEPNYIKVI